MSSERILRKNIDEVVEDSFIFIKNHYRIFNSRHGWHQFLGSNKVGVVATAQALLCFCYFAEDFNEKHLAITMLRESQFKDNSASTLDGGWSYVTNASLFPTTECTAWSLLLLLKENNTESVSKGIEWLFANSSTSESNGMAWGSTRYDEPRMYSTALVLRVMVKANLVRTDQFRRTKDWLMMARNLSDGGWGEKKGSPSTFVHTAHALIALVESGIRRDSEIIGKACDWLLSEHTPEMPWSDPQLAGLVEHFDIKSPPGFMPTTQRVTYFHFALPWIVNALVTCGRTNRMEVFHGINWLLQNCQKGYWDHPYLVSKKEKPMWAIHDSLLALSTFRGEFPNWSQVERIVLKDGNIEVKTVSKTQSSFFRRLSRFWHRKTVWAFLVIAWLIVILLIILKKITLLDGALVGIMLPVLMSLTANMLTPKDRSQERKR